MPAEAFDDLADPARAFFAAGGELVVAEVDGHIAAMGGFRLVAELPDRLEILRVRVHPARRRLGLGAAICRDVASIDELRCLGEPHDFPSRFCT